MNKEPFILATSKIKKNNLRISFRGIQIMSRGGRGVLSKVAESRINIVDYVRGRFCSFW